MELVTDIPKMSGIYARALSTLGRRPSNPTMPDTVLAYRGAHADPAQLAAYRKAVHAPMNGVLPSLYVHTLAFPLAMSLMIRKDFPLPLLGMIHLSNEIAVDRPLGEDELFDIEVHAENLAAHRQGAACDLIVRILVDGEQRMLLRSTFLAKGVKLPGAVQPHERAEFTAPQRTALWRLDAGTGRRWAAAAGDYNPIHLSAVSAKALGMPRAIAHGIYLAARALAGIEPSSGSYRWQIQFKTPVFLPGSVQVAFRRTAAGFEVDGFSSKGKPHFALELEA